MYRCGPKGYPSDLGGKADSFVMLEGSSPECAMVSIQRLHRGFRPGHLPTGVARELGRSKCFLENEAESGTGHKRANVQALVRGALSLPMSEIKGAIKVSGADSE